MLALKTTDGEKSDRWTEIYLSKKTEQLDRKEAGQEDMWIGRQENRQTSK